MRLKDYKQKVKEILKDHPKARNNDGTLIAHFIYRHVNHLIVKDGDDNWSLPLKNLKHLPPFETIRRARQLIQNTDNEYLPTSEEVRRHRRIKEEEWCNWEVREAVNS